MHIISDSISQTEYCWDKNPNPWGKVRYDV